MSSPNHPELLPSCACEALVSRSKSSPGSNLSKIFSNLGKSGRTCHGPGNRRSIRYKSDRWIDSDKPICHLRTCSGIRCSHRICRNFTWMNTIGTSGLLRFQLFMHDRIMYFGHNNPQYMENNKCFRTYNVSPSQCHWQLVGHWVWSHWERFPGWFRHRFLVQILHIQPHPHKKPSSSSAGSLPSSWDGMMQLST